MNIPKDILEACPKVHMEFLKQLFAQCPSNVFESISINHYTKNHNLISTYRDSSYVFILLKGKLRAIEERMVAIPYSFTEVTPIDIVGDYELFTEIEGHYVTLNTLEASTCLQIPSTMYLYWMKHDANALFIRTQMLMRVLSVQTQLQRQYLFMDTKTKFILYLLTICKRQRVSPVYHILETREIMVAHIGCSVRTLNRTIQEMRKQHELQLEHGKIVLTDQQLKQLRKSVVDYDIDSH